MAICAGTVLAGPETKGPKASAEFEKMKALVGTWKGTANMGQGDQEITLVYRLVSGGSAIEEKIFEGTPHEMVTMYYDKGGKLALTHYCALGNRPGLIMKSSDAKKIQFDFDPACGVGDQEMHMHSMTVTFDGPDTIVQDWQLYTDGKLKDSHPFTLKRVKA
jgi:hypothetical protein